MILTENIGPYRFSKANKKPTQMKIMSDINAHGDDPVDIQMDRSFDMGVPHRYYGQRIESEFVTSPRDPEHDGVMEQRGDRPMINILDRYYPAHHVIDRYNSVRFVALKYGLPLSQVKKQLGI